MIRSELLARRLYNQHLTSHPFKKPQELVQSLVAVQSQEYAQAKWALGLRIPGLKDAGAEKAFAEGKILRTHVMRPTWHFVAPADIRWLQQLTGPRVLAFMSSMNRKLELDAKTFQRSTDVIARALEGGKFLTRTDLADALTRAKIKVGDGVRLAHLVMYAELEAVICSGPREGKQFTYALLDERVKTKPKAFDRDAALYELASRYFTTRGPATIHDFSWWSGLTITDARKGAAELDRSFRRATIDGKEYIFRESDTVPKTTATFLMPDYDEYGICYKDRSAIFEAPNVIAKARENFIFNHMIVIDGIIKGTWKRIEKKEKREAEIKPFTPLNPKEKKSVAKAIKAFNDFY